MKFDVFINFADGKCAEAVDFYAENLGLTPGQTMKYSDAPDGSMGDMELSDEEKSWIMYTELKIGDNMVMFSDTPSSIPFAVGNNISPCLIFDDESTARNVFAKFSVGGTDIMPLAKTFWSPLYGMVTDKYGVVWQIMVSDEV